ncbi:hypothetical protein [Tolypothrix sp. VBCCA 56010]|uniref:hypothetical protein n=1 Tax=Tolypothrix sp. VBCCA 56010 TaxID=3137731 RepID=UPI003D7D26C7
MIAQVENKRIAETEQVIAPDLQQDVTQQTSPNREFIKHLLIGSPKAVKSTIHYLQVLGYADVGAWSPLLPTANPGEFMSILSRSILVQ